MPAAKRTMDLIDAVLALKKKQGLAADDQAHAGDCTSDSASAYPDAAIHEAVLNRSSASMAVAMIDGQALPAQYTDARAADRAVAELRNRIDVSEDPALPRRTSVVSLTLNDGTTYTETIPHPTGTPGNPMSDAMVKEFNALAAAVFPAEKAERAACALWDVDKLSNVRELIPLLVGG
jgi:2-methylcitrate dehydratase PrpD